jgi:DNA-binding GntR family transcriptional regulator
VATLTLSIYESVRRKILTGTIAPGARLIIRQLAHEYQTSDIPIREALRMLERDGLVQMVPYKGARVVSLSPAEIEEGYLIRGHLESLATRTAVGRLSDDDCRQLERCMRSMAKAIDAGDALGYAELNREFHEIIFSASPYRRLQDLLDSIWDGQGSFQMVFRLSPDWLHRSYREHRLIFDALRAEDEERAAEIALQHKLSASAALVAAIKAGADQPAHQEGA